MIRCAVLMGLAGLTGCAQAVTVRRWQPAAIDVAGLHRIAVVDFQGEHGPEVAAALRTCLMDNRFYALVDPVEIAPVQHAVCSQAATCEQWLCRARERGIDGVILGEVREYRCEDEVVRHGERASENNPPADESERGRWSFGRGAEETLSRQVSVVVAFRFVDAQTGEVRAAHEASRRSHGEHAAAGEPLPSRDEVLQQLTQECLDEFLELLTPHLVESQLLLARGKWYSRGAAAVREGNRLALRGDWDAARDRWQAAVAQHGDCDAALYNLAVDATRRLQYGEAEELAMRAIRTRHTDLYAQGLEQIRRYRTGYEAVEQQRSQRILQASALQ